MKFKSLALVLAMTMCITQNASYASSLPSTQAVKPDNLMSEITRQPVQYTSLLELADHSALAPMTAEQLASITGGVDINRFGVLTPNQFMILTIGWVAYQSGIITLQNVLDFSGIHNNLLKAVDPVCDILGTLLPGYARQSQLGAANLDGRRDFDVIDGLYGLAGGLIGALAGGACKFGLAATQRYWDAETIKMDKQIVDAVNAQVTNTTNGRRLHTIGKDANGFVEWYADDLTTNNNDAANAKSNYEFWTKLFSTCYASGKPYVTCVDYYSKASVALKEYQKYSGWSKADFYGLVYKSGEWYNALGLKMKDTPTIGGRRMSPKVYPIRFDPDMTNPNAHR
jgi:hypothetical protein